MWSSFTVHGIQLFNSMPQHVRDKKNILVASFKKNLDDYLANVPDEPLIPGYTARKQDDTNSLLHMPKLVKSVVVPFNFRVNKAEEVSRTTRKPERTLKLTNK